MRTVRLAQFFELKYGFKSEAQADERRINDVKQALIDAYNNYINVDTVRTANNILPLLAGQNEPHAARLITLMESLVANIDSIDLHDVRSGINDVLSYIGELQKDTKTFRNNIHDIFPAKSQKEMAKSKFETIVFKSLARILATQSKILGAMIGSTEPVTGGPSEPQVKEPSAQDIFKFRLTPTAVHYGLDRPEVFGEIWLNPVFKRQIIYLINSAKKRAGKDSFFDSPEVAQETAAIMEAFKREQERQRTNENYFDASEDDAQQMTQAVPAEEAWSREMLRRKQEIALERAENPTPENEKSASLKRLAQIMKRYQ